MEKTIEQKLDSIFSCGDLAECGRRLAAFSQEALESSQRAALVKAYYKRIISIRQEDVLFNGDAPFYKVFKGEETALRYLSIHSPARYADRKTLVKLCGLGRSMSESFVRPKGAGIKEEQIEQVLDYLDKEFGFADKVFRSRKPYFVLLNQCHSQESSHWCQVESGAGEGICILLYPGRSEAERPVDDLFLQLAEILYHRCGYERDDLSFTVIEALEELSGVAISRLSQQEQVKTAACCICLGMMHESPFESNN